MQQTITGKAYVLGDNVDTDQIIPAQYLTYDPAKADEYRMFGKFALNGVPAAQGGLPKGRVPFHDPGDEFTSPYKIIVGGKNFGCGSSREHAPWALLDFGIRCVISTSFADIFYNNCFKNGILPIKVSPEDLDKLFDDAERGANATLTIDLEAQEIRGPDGGVVKFEVDEHRKHCLLNGLDDIGLTMEKAPAIEAYEKKLGERAWA